MPRRKPIAIFDEPYSHGIGVSINWEPGLRADLVHRPGLHWDMGGARWSFYLYPLRRVGWGLYFVCLFVEICYCPLLPQFLPVSLLSGTF